MKDFKLGRGIEIVQPTFPQINLQPAITNFEPSRTNRFILYVLGVDIPIYLIRRYELNSENGRIFTLKFNFIETVNFMFDPYSVNDITGFRIEFLDPTGVVANTIELNAVNCIGYQRSGDYSNDDLLNNTLTFIVVKTEE